MEEPTQTTEEAEITTILAKRYGEKEEYIEYNEEVAEEIYNIFKVKEANIMTKRCRHEFETKDGYPDDMLCQKCQTIWTITDYVDWTAKQIMTLPLVVRREVLKRTNGTDG